MADKEKEKTHRVRLGGSWTFEKHYPGADPFVVTFPAGTTVEMRDQEYQSLKRMNDAPGRPTLTLERLGDGDAVDVSIPEMIAKVDAELERRGIVVKGAERVMVEGKYKGLFQTATDATEAATATKSETTTDAGDTKKGGK